MRVKQSLGAKGHIVSNMHSSNVGIRALAA